MQRNAKVNKKTREFRLSRRRRVARQLRRMARRQRNARRRMRTTIPIASAQNFRRRMNNTTVSATTARVSGSDLVYKIPDVLPMTSDSSVIAVIPSNPAYWLGTKIATIARGYQNYRPVRFTVHYKPHCAATQAGNVIGGTIYHETPAVDNLQQSLKTSNGGIMTQVFKPATAKVKVGSNLQKNLYRVGGDINDDSMPFYYIAIAIACKQGDARINPGYFYVDYTYIFKNPIGGSQQFANSGVTKFTDQIGTMRKQNVKTILCEPFIAETLTLGIGTTLDVEYSTEDQAWRFYYNGTLINSPNTYLWVLSNDQGNALNQNQMQQMSKQPIIYNYLSDNDPELPTVVPDGDAVAYERYGTINTFVNNTGEMHFVQFDPSIKQIYHIYNAAQDLGTLQNISFQTLTWFVAEAASKYLKYHSVARPHEQHTISKQKLQAYGLSYIPNNHQLVADITPTMPNRTELTKEVYQELAIRREEYELNEQLNQLTLEKKKRKEEKENAVDYKNWDPEKDYYNRQPEPDQSKMPQANLQPEPILSQQEIQSEVEADNGQEL